MFVALKSRGSQLFRTTSECLQANAFAHRCSCVGCNRLAFDILTSTNGDEPIADILPGCWSDRTTDAIDLQADQCVFNRRAAALPRCSLVTSTHTHSYTKLVPELGRLGLAQGLGLWVMPVLKNSRKSRPNKQKTTLERAEYVSTMCNEIQPPDASTDAPFAPAGTMNTCRRSLTCSALALTRSRRSTRPLQPWTRTRLDWLPTIRCWGPLYVGWFRMQPLACVIEVLWMW